MLKQDLVINDLIQLAINNYDDGINANLFAASAAHQFASAAAAEFSPDSADSSALVAALQYANTLIGLAHHLGQQSVSEANQLHARQNYTIASKKKNELTQTHIDTSSSFFQKIADMSYEHKPIDAYNEHYAQSNQEELILDAQEDEQPVPVAREKSHELALRAACNHYAHALTSARAAYLSATAMAARYHTDAARQEAFERHITKRLTMDLKHEPMEPSLYLQIINSELVTLIGTILLVVGLIALSLELAGLTIAGFAATLITAGLTQSILTTAGAAMTVAGAGVFTCQFFAEKQWQNDNDASRYEAEAMNLTP